ncbi:hypothetical protein B0H17DRAFT_1201322 [Mycena rosella]|uniref:ATP-dependent RNA helicase n=1 Tax=Mycena rosella TaxID=1033263 RepID=A0AAD7DID7_MYCRO|nr:hypothetical protein B0H17DRAFT_1201322 [Mycena rosella]
MYASAFASVSSLVVHIAFATLYLFVVPDIARCLANISHTPLLFLSSLPAHSSPGHGLAHSHTLSPATALGVSSLHISLRGRRRSLLLPRKVLDKIDLVAVTPTGSSKTGFLFLTIIVMIAIAANPSLCPSASFPKDPAIVVVCPTNSIEQQMEENMAKLGIRAVMINADTMAAARIRGEDLWSKARAGISMLILGPEKLISKGFQDLLKCDSFMTIVFMRARFRSGIPLIGLTATLLSEPAIADAIFNLLGVNRGEFYLLRRSNARHDIQILFRTLHSGIDGLGFPELAWVVKNQDKTIIFGTTISLVFRIKIYLDSLLPKGVDRDLRVRAYHSINWPDKNLETIELFKTNPLCQIIVSTNGLAQGNDISVIKTVIQSDAENAADAKKDGTVAMDRPVAEIISSRCKPFIQDNLFGNPAEDTPCLCKTCTTLPPTARPTICRCSDCLPEVSADIYTPKPKDKKPPSDIPASHRLTKPMKEVGTARLEEFRLTVWFEASDLTSGLTPLAEFLPDDVIRLILDRISTPHCLV